MLLVLLILLCLFANNKAVFVDDYDYDYDYWEGYDLSDCEQTWLVATMKPNLERDHFSNRICQKKRFLLTDFVNIYTSIVKIDLLSRSVKSSYTKVSLNLESK